jgi:hypothetical protein
MVRGRAIPEAIERAGTALVERGGALLPVGGPPWAVDVVRRVPRLLLAYHRGEDPRCELDHGRDKPDEAVTQADPGGQLMCERHQTGEVEA